MDIRACGPDDFETIGEIINAAAEAYRGVIPEDRWKEPYMTLDELRHEVAEGVVFSGCFDAETLVGVMGLQDVQDVTLVRHAYVRPDRQRQGIGGALLEHLQLQARRPILVGTWRAATWAIELYQRHGFALVTEDQKERLLRRYWSIDERQVEESVVLAQVTCAER